MPRQARGTSPPAFSPVVRSLCLIRSPDRINEQLAEYRDAGVTHVQLRVASDGCPSISSTVR
jgi:hypothetical protein